MDTVKRNCERCGAEFEAVIGAVGAGHRRRFCTENCQKRSVEDRNRATCGVCGAPMAAGSKWRGYGQCGDCTRAAEQARIAARARQIVEWWAEGVPIKVIGLRLGWTAKHAGVEIIRLREKGFDLPYRYRAGERAGRKHAA